MSYSPVANRMPEAEDKIRSSLIRASTYF